MSFCIAANVSGSIFYFLARAKTNLDGGKDGARGRIDPSWTLLFTRDCEFVLEIISSTAVAFWLIFYACPFFFFRLLLLVDEMLIFTKKIIIFFWQILVAPAVAGVAVGVGVPILLAYVYGVVPISLCRSGVCGVSASPRGVRIDFNDQGTIDGNANDNSSSVYFANNKNTDAMSVDTGNPLVGNPSIGKYCSLSSLLCHNDYVYV